MTTSPGPSAGAPPDAWRELRHPSPDGTYVFAVDSREVRMSHWIDTPTLLRAATDEPVLRFASTAWSLDGARWDSATRVELSLRKYPGAHRPPVLVVTLDLVTGTAGLPGGGDVPLDDLERALDDLLAAG